MAGSTSFQGKHLFRGRAVLNARAKSMLRFCLLLISVFGLPARPNEAATLLAEFIHEGTTVHELPAPDTVPFVFGASDAPPIYFIWEDEHGPSDVGMTFSAPPDIVQSANLAIHSPTATYSATMSGTRGETYEPSRPGCGHCNIFVPAADWSAYALTSIERIIDELAIITNPPFGGFYTVEGKHRIQLWAEPIPEPTTLLLSILGIGYSTTIETRHRPKRDRLPNSKAL